jgi:hypothetical protein
VSLLTRKTVNGLREFKLLRERITEAAQRHFGGRPARERRA